MPKVGIDIYDAALLCGVVCDFLYLNEKNSRKLRSDHEKIEAAKYYQLAYDVNSITEEIDPQEIQERLNNLFD